MKNGCLLGSVFLFSLSTAVAFSAKAAAIYFFMLTTTLPFARPVST